MVGPADDAEHKVFLVHIRVFLARLRPLIVYGALIVLTEQWARRTVGAMPMFFFIPLQECGDELLSRSLKMMCDSVNIVVGEDRTQPATAVGTPGTVNDLKHFLVQLQSDAIHFLAGRPPFQPAEEIVILGIVILGVRFPVVHYGVVGVVKHVDVSVVIFQPASHIYHIYSLSIQSESTSFRCPGLLLTHHSRRSVRFYAGHYVGTSN